MIGHHFMFWREGLTIGGIVLFAVNTSYFVLTENRVTKVIALLFRQSAHIKAITRVRKELDSPVFQFPTIYIDYTNRWGRKRSIELNISLFGERAMREFLIKLLRLRDDISLNAESRRFMENKEPPSKSWKDQLMAAMFPGERQRLNRKEPDDRESAQET